MRKGPINGGVIGPSLLSARESQVTASLKRSLAYPPLSASVIVHCPWVPSLLTFWVSVLHPTGVSIPYSTLHVIGAKVVMQLVVGGGFIAIVPSVASLWVGLGRYAILQCAHGAVLKSGRVTGGIGVLVCN
jgi:hypothetical protein